MIVSQECYPDFFYPTRITSPRIAYLEPAALVKRFLRYDKTMPILACQTVKRLSPPGSNRQNRFDIRLKHTNKFMEHYNVFLNLTQSISNYNSKQLLLLKPIRAMIA